MEKDINVLMSYKYYINYMYFDYQELIIYKKLFIFYK